MMVMAVSYPIIQELLRKVQRQVDSRMDISIKATAGDLKGAIHHSASGQQIPYSARMGGQERGESNLGGSEGEHALRNHTAHGVSNNGNFRVEQLLFIARVGVGVGVGVKVTTGAHSADGVDNLPGIVGELGDGVAGATEEGGVRGVRAAYAAVVDDDRNNFV